MQSHISVVALLQGTVVRHTVDLERGRILKISTYLKSPSGELMRCLTNQLKVCQNNSYFAYDSGVRRFGKSLAGGFISDSSLASSEMAEAGRCTSAWLLHFV